MFQQFKPVLQHFYRRFHNSSRCSSSPNRSSSTFIDNSITPADVPSVLPGSPALYIEDSTTPVDVPAVVLHHFYRGLNHSSRCSRNPKWSSITFISNSTTPAGDPVVLNGPSALLQRIPHTHQMFQ